jgi:hypothetical protein
MLQAMLHQKLQQFPRLIRLLAGRCTRQPSIVYAKQLCAASWHRERV